MMASMKQIIKVAFVGDREKWKELRKSIDTFRKEFSKEYGRVFIKMNNYLSRLLNQ